MMNSQQISWGHRTLGLQCISSYILVLKLWCFLSSFSSYKIVIIISLLFPLFACKVVLMVIPWKWPSYCSKMDSKRLMQSGVGSEARMAGRYSSLSFLFFFNRCLSIPSMLGSQFLLVELHWTCTMSTVPHLDPLFINQTEIVLWTKLATMS